MEMCDVLQRECFPHFWISDFNAGVLPARKIPKSVSLSISDFAEATIYNFLNFCILNF